MTLLRTLLATLLAATALSVPATAAGARVDDQPVSPPAAEALPPADLPFPGVPGVDLAELGYDGPELGVVDLTTPPDLEALPADLFGRAQAAADQVETLVEQRDGLEQLAELLRRVIDDLNPRIGEQRRATAFAKSRAAQAEQRLATLSARIRVQQAELQTHEERMVDAAIAAYIHPPDADTVDAVLKMGATTTDQLAAPVLHEAKFEHDLVVKDLREVEVATLESRRRVLSVSEQEARRRSRAATAQLDQLVARRQAHTFALVRTSQAQTEIETRLETWRGVLDEVAAAFAFSDDSIVAAAQSGGVEVPTVAIKGIRINAVLAARLEAMQTAAHDDGIELKGWGYRSHDSQIALRQAHCGPNPEDVWLKPAGECAPPTAIPGTSMHEIGLAIDFTYDGASISTHDSPAYQWLAAHAADYGFFNLPSEPWHWSVNGR